MFYIEFQHKIGCWNAWVLRVFLVLELCYATFLSSSNHCQCYLFDLNFVPFVTTFVTIVRTRRSGFTCSEAIIHLYSLAH
uniref:Putative secreted protein n=1 Tax=Anopheles marajoara TaxID=58244 RepID=A0A2M4CCW4_9DIPT